MTFEPGPNKPKRTPLMSPTKNLKPKNLFSLQNRRLAKSFEGLYSCLAQLTGEL